MALPAARTWTCCGRTRRRTARRSTRYAPANKGRGLHMLKNQLIAGSYSYSLPLPAQSLSASDPSGCPRTRFPRRHRRCGHWHTRFPGNGFYFCSMFSEAVRDDDAELAPHVALLARALNADLVTSWRGSSIGPVLYPLGPEAECPRERSTEAHTCWRGRDFRGTAATRDFSCLAGATECRRSSPHRSTKRAQ